MTVQRKTNEQKLGIAPAAGVSGRGYPDEDCGPERPRDTLKDVPGLSGNTVKKQEEIVRRVKIEFVADEKLAQKIDRAKAVLRHKYPNRAQQTFGMFRT